jgi:hypothetical protein
MPAFNSLVLPRDQNGTPGAPHLPGFGRCGKARSKPAGWPGAWPELVEWLSILRPGIARSARYYPPPPPSPFEPRLPERATARDSRDEVRIRARPLVGPLRRRRETGAPDEPGFGSMGWRSAFHGSVASVCQELARGRARTPRPPPPIANSPPNPPNVENLSSFSSSVRKFSPTFHTTSALIRSKIFGVFWCWTWYPDNRGQRRNFRPNRSKTKGRASAAFSFSGGERWHAAAWRSTPCPPHPPQGVPKRPRNSPIFSYLPQSKTPLPQAPQMQKHATSYPQGGGGYQLPATGYRLRARPTPNPCCTLRI